ncbi:MAG TPA: type II CAAX endopeptidase family protein [Candidatus Acidoferrales bacterium]|nr:type II CAAX endopeptidase family protein [Candidatus Acidoferrales bacterium]
MDVNEDPSQRLESLTPRADDGSAATAAAAAERPPQTVWPGVLFWLALGAGYLALGMTAFFKDLWFVAPLIAAIVIAQAVERAPRVRRLCGRVITAAALGGIIFGSQLLIHRNSLDFRTEIHAEAMVVAMFVGSFAILLCLLRGVRGRFFPALGLDPASSLHATAAAMFVLSLMFVGWLFVALLDEPGETILVDLKDPIVALLTDIPLALAGVGYLIRRDLRQTLMRLGLVPITFREMGAAVLVTVPLVLAVALFERAEEAFLPEIHALEDRFPMKFADVSPVLGIPAMSLAAGVGEEAIFRGALQPRFGIVLTSLLFAAMHIQYQLPGMILIFWISVFLGIVRNRKSTTFTVFVHMAYDLIAFSLAEF